MSEFYSLDDLKREVNHPAYEKIDENIRKANKFIYLIRDVFEERGIKARVDVVGSTNEKRLTYVLDFSNLDNPFPPDVDIVIEVSQDNDERLFEDFNPDVWAKLTGLESKLIVQRKLITSLVDEGHITEDPGILKFVTGLGQVYLYCSVIDNKATSPYQAFSYMDKIGEITREQAREIKSFKLFTRRNGIAGASNNGFSGRMCEELVLRCGSAEATLDELNTQFQEDHPHIEGVAFGGNLLRSISHHVRNRTRLALRRYKKDGMVKSKSYSQADWESQLDKRIDLSLDFPCGPITCGREADSIYHQSRDVLARLLNPYNIRRGIDIHVIPYMNSWGNICHTRVFASIPSFSQARDVKKAYIEEISKINSSHEHTVPNKLNLLADQVTQL